MGGKRTWVSRARASCGVRHAAAGAYVFATLGQRRNRLCAPMMHCVHKWPAGTRYRSVLPRPGFGLGVDVIDSTRGATGCTDVLNDCAAAVRCPSMALPTHIMCVVWMRDSDDSNASNEDDGATRTLPLPLTLTLLELVSACTCEVPNPRPTLATLLPSSPRRPVFYCTPPPPKPIITPPPRPPHWPPAWGPGSPPGR